MPRTRVSPSSSALRAAAAQPSVVSWSVSPSTSSPAALAARTSSSAVCVPSLARVWVWRSMRTVEPYDRTPTLRSAPAQGQLHLLGHRGRGAARRREGDGDLHLHL